jgi:hypothetical protein
MISIVGPVVVLDKSLGRCLAIAVFLRVAFERRREVIDDIDCFEILGAFPSVGGATDEFEYTCVRSVIRC